MNVVENQRDSPLLAQGLDLIRTSGTDACVLISMGVSSQAETVARRIHAVSPSPRGRFVPIDCAAAPPVLEEDMFARVNGRYAQGACTLFLKEVGRLSMEHQRRLLASLIDATLASWPTRVRARVIACTSESLLDRVIHGTFDDRLFYRLNVIHLDLRQV